MTTEATETTDELTTSLTRLARTDPNRLIAVCDLGEVMELAAIDLLRKSITVHQRKLAILRNLKEKVMRAIVSEQPTAEPGTQPAN